METKAESKTLAMNEFFKNIGKNYHYPINVVMVLDYLFVNIREQMDVPNN